LNGETSSCGILQSSGVCTSLLSTRC